MLLLVQLSLFDGFVGAVEDVLHGGVQILLAHAVQGGLRSPDLADGGVGGADDLLGQDFAGRVEPGSLELLGGDVVGGGVVEGDTGVGLIGRLRTGRRQLDAKSSYSVPMARQGSSRVTRVPKCGRLCTLMQLVDPAYSRSRAPMLCSPMPVLR